MPWLALLTLLLKNSCCAVFAHGSHAALQDTFAYLSSLLNGRSRLAKTVVAGDFNVDILPDHRSDPFASTPGRIDHQADRRQLLHNFSRLYGFSVPDVDLVLSSPGGPFSDLTARCPISRLPLVTSWEIRPVWILH